MAGKIKEQKIDVNAKSPNKQKKECKDCKNLQKCTKFTKQEWVTDNPSCIRCLTSYIQCESCRMEKFPSKFPAKRRIDHPLCRECCKDMNDLQKKLPARDGEEMIDDSAKDSDEDGVQKQLDFGQVSYNSMILDKIIDGCRAICSMTNSPRTWLRDTV